MSIITPLHGHTDEQTAYVVNDYPYGFRLRCKIRYWIEENKNGMRFCSQTTNPKRDTEVWNKPKKSTYIEFMGLYLDENNHVNCYGLGQYKWEEKHEELLTHWPEVVQTELGKKRYIFMLASLKAAKHITYKIGGTPQREEEKERTQQGLNNLYKHCILEASREVNAK